MCTPHKEPRPPVASVAIAVDRRARRGRRAAPARSIRWASAVNEVRERDNNCEVRRSDGDINCGAAAGSDDDVGSNPRAG
jgi:hypothetical protein